MITEFICSDADAGAFFPEENRFLLSLIRSRAPDTKAWTSANIQDRVFESRDEFSLQSLFRFDVHYSRTPLCIGGAMYFLSNSCLPFYGQLQLVSVPHGSEFEIVLSTDFVPPRVSRFKHYGDGYVPTNWWRSNFVPYSPPQPLSRAGRRC
jgi:hypothetical protein